MVAFISSFLALLACGGLVVAYAKRRPVGTSVTWGEAMIAAVFIFGVMFLAYGIVPHQFLNWADSELRWRPDKQGIPVGPLSHLFSDTAENHWYSHSKNVLWPNGITFFGRGKIIVTKETIRDIIAATLYIVFLGGQIKLWSIWQNRGKVAEAKAKAEIDVTSTYGRPLIKRA
jgi:hypothetical protein